MIYYFFHSLMEMYSVPTACDYYKYVISWPSHFASVLLKIGSSWKAWLRTKCETELNGTSFILNCLTCFSPHFRPHAPSFIKLSSMLPYSQHMSNIQVSWMLNLYTFSLISTYLSNLYFPITFLVLSSPRHFLCLLPLAFQIFDMRRLTCFLIPDCNQEASINKYLIDFKAMYSRFSKTLIWYSAGLRPDIYFYYKLVSLAYFFSWE